MSAPSPSSPSSHPATVSSPAPSAALPPARPKVGPDAPGRRAAAARPGQPAHARRSRVDLDRVRDQLDILELARELTTLKKVGDEWRGGCPCCGSDAKDLPFAVYPGGRGGKRPHFNAFCCGANGDVFDLWYFKHEGQPRVPKHQFLAVVRDVADSKGITVPGLSDAPESEAQRFAAAVEDAWAAAASYVQDTLRRNPDAAAARAHLATLGADEQAVAGLAEAGLGYVVGDGAA